MCGGLKVHMFKVRDITVPKRHRCCEKSKVKQLAESIKEHGLLQPICVTDDGNLVFGRHRLEAFQLLDRFDIPAYVRTMGDLDAELLMIDENLCRNELTALEQAEQLKRRKEIYEARHPETRRESHLNQGPKRQHGVTGETPENKAFSADAAAKTGLSQRTIQRDISTAENLTEPAKTQIVDLPIANNKKQLAELAALPDGDQLKVAVELGKGAKSVEQAKKAAKVKESKPTTKLKDAKDKIVPESLVAPWNKALEYDGVSRELSGVLRKVKEIMEDRRAAAYLDILAFEKDIKNLKHQLKFAKPYVVCRLCGGSGCVPCKKAGWMPESTMTRNAKE